MNKKLIVGIAIVLILVGGSFASAQAGCLSWLSPCNWHSSCSTQPAQPLDYSWRPNPCHCGFNWISPCCWNLGCCPTSGT